jgi:hypothetical protein
MDLNGLKHRKNLLTERKIKAVTVLSDSLRCLSKLISFSWQFAAFAEAERSTMVPVAPVARSTSWNNST